MISFLKMLLRASYKFKVKEKKSLIVFDDEEKLECARLFKEIKNKTLILPVRFYAINEIYLTPGILLKTIKFIFLGNYNFSAYLSALILEIEAKVVVSTMDNSIQFSNAAKILKNKVEFIAIQRAACDSIIFLPNKIVKKIFIPKFLCFGELEKKLYKATSAQVHKFIPVGSYHNSNFENYYKKKIKIKYDLCLLAEIPYTNSEDSVERSSEELDRGFTLINFTQKFAKKYNLKLVIAGKRPKTNTSRDRRRISNTKKEYLEDPQKMEFELYKKLLGRQLKLILNKPPIYSSYKTASSSRVIIGGSSTLLREMLAAKKKILVWRPNSKRGRNFPLDGICSLKTMSYKKFEKRLLQILKLSYPSYVKKINKKVSYVMHYDKNITTNNKILKIVNNYLQ